MFSDVFDRSSGKNSKSQPKTKVFCLRNMTTPAENDAVKTTKNKKTSDRPHRKKAEMAGLIWNVGPCRRLIESELGSYRRARERDPKKKGAAQNHTDFYVSPEAAVSLAAAEQQFTYELFMGSIEQMRLNKQVRLRPEHLQAASSFDVHTARVLGLGTSVLETAMAPAGAVSRSLGRKKRRLDVMRTVDSDRNATQAEEDSDSDSDVPTPKPVKRTTKKKTKKA